MKETTLNEMKAKALIAIAAQSDRVSEVYKGLCDAREWGESRWIRINERQMAYEHEIERGLRDAYKFAFEEDAPCTIYDIEKEVDRLAKLEISR